MKRLLIITVWIAAIITGIIFCGVFLPSYPFKRVKTQECPVCRAQLRTRTSSVSKKTATQYQTNEFSVWYGQAVEPEHVHTWVLRGITTYNVFGVKNGSASGEKYRFFSIEPISEKEFLERHFDKNTIVDVVHKLHQDRFADLIDSCINSGQEQVSAVSNKVEIIRKELRKIEPSTPTNASNLPLK